MLQVGVTRSRMPSGFAPRCTEIVRPFGASTAIAVLFPPSAGKGLPLANLILALADGIPGLTGLVAATIYNTLFARTRRCTAVSFATIARRLRAALARSSSLASNQAGDFDAPLSSAS